MKYKITYNDASEIEFVHNKRPQQNTSLSKVLEDIAPNIKQVEILGADNAPLTVGNQAQLFDDEIFVPAETLLNAYDFDVWFNTSLQCLS